MNKKELIDAIAQESGVTKADIDRVLVAYENVIVNTLKKGEKVTLVGFGTYTVTERKARIGRNPASGATINIPAKKQAKLLMGKSFKDAF